MCSKAIDSTVSDAITSGNGSKGDSDETRKLGVDRCSTGSSSCLFQLSTLGLPLVVDFEDDLARWDTGHSTQALGNRMMLPWKLLFALGTFPVHISSAWFHSVSAERH